MAGLTGKPIGTTYKSVLRVDDDTGLDTGLELITDGEGTKSSLSLSDDATRIQPQTDDTIAAFHVRSKGGQTLFSVDTTNSVVKAGVGAYNVLTQYVTFGVNYQQWESCIADTHYPVPFSTSGGEHATNDVDFGTGSTPDTTFSTSNTDTNYASQIVPCMWYINDNIEIDAAYAISGAAGATGDTTKMHLMCYTFNSGSNSCLTSGKLLGATGTQVNAGNEQAYGQAFTMESDNTVTAGKVVLAFFSQNGTNADYSVNIQIKYHLV